MESINILERSKILKLDEPPFVGRFRYLEKLNFPIDSTIRCGILFLMAYWSGTSFRSFSRLKQTLERLDPAGLLEVVIVDVDGCEAYENVPEKIRAIVGGNGETAWIIKGKVIATASCGSHPKAFETYTRYLLDEGLAEANFGNVGRPCGPNDYL